MVSRTSFGFSLGSGIAEAGRANGWKFDLFSCLIRRCLRENDSTLLSIPDPCHSKISRRDRRNQDERIK